MARADAPRVAAGSWRIERRDEEGKKVSVLVPQTVPVNEQGENVSVTTEDGRAIQVSRKLAELYPERYTATKSKKASAGDQVGDQA